jgi:hypothetical protein
VSAAVARGVPSLAAEQAREIVVVQRAQELRLADDLALPRRVHLDRWDAADDGVGAVDPRIRRAPDAEQVGMRGGELRVVVVDQAALVGGAEPARHHLGRVLEQHPEVAAHVVAAADAVARRDEGRVGRVHGGDGVTGVLVEVLRRDEVGRGLFQEVVAAGSQRHDDRSQQRDGTKTGSHVGPRRAQ